MKRMILPITIVLVCALELYLALSGPMAFVQKPSVIVTNPFSYGIEPEDVDEVFAHVQKSLAATKLFRVISHDLIEDYFFEKQDDPDFTLDRRLTYNDYKELATDLEIDRIAVITVTPGSENVAVTIVLRLADSGDGKHRFTYTSANVDAFVEGFDVDGNTFNIVKDFRIQTRGVGIFDNLFFAFLLGEAILAIFLLIRRPRLAEIPARFSGDTLNQVLFVAGTVLGLFAFVYAQNAGMDYVQRFIAEEGNISLAGSVEVEQRYTIFRFLPLLLINILVYVFPRILIEIERRRKASFQDSSAAESVSKPPHGIRFIASWIDERFHRWGIFAALLSAFLMAVSFPSFLSLRGFPLLAWIGLVPLLVCIAKVRVGTGIFYLVSFGALHSIILNYWHGTYSYISLAFTVLICCVLYLLFAVVFVPAIRKNRYSFLVAPALWVVFEYSRSLFYIAYPWGLFGASQYLVRPMIQITDLTGIWGVSFLVVLVNASIAATIIRLSRPMNLSAAQGDPVAVRNRGSRLGAHPAFPTGIAALVFILAGLYGVIRLATIPEKGGKSMRVTLVQQNTDPRKHDYQLSLDTLEELTESAIQESATGDGKSLDLIVWPEGGLKTDIRYWLDRSNASGAGPEMVREFMEFQEELGVWLVTGTSDHIYITEPNGDEKRRNFNSSVTLDETGEILGFYHKIHLVPFTEHFPYKEQLPWLTELLDKFDTSDWLAGDERTIFEHPRASFFTPLCFEDIFPNDIRLFVRDGADLIVNMSNDYWSLTPVEGKQHAIHAIFRAVENRRPMVRATASGLTTYITPTGRLWRDSLEYYIADYMTVDIPILERGTTLYTRFGDWFPKSCLIAVTSALAFAAGMTVYRRNRRSRG